MAASLALSVHIHVLLPLLFQDAFREVFVAAEAGVEPAIRESKSRALPFGDSAIQDQR